MEHTKTPWGITGNNKTIVEAKLCSGGQTIANMHYQGDCPTLREAQANAAFIVQACNSHDALLEGCIAACRMLCTRYTAGELRESEDWAIIDAAIDKTKGE